MPCLSCSGGRSLDASETRQRACPQHRNDQTPLLPRKKQQATYMERFHPGGFLLLLPPPLGDWGWGPPGWGGGGPPPGRGEAASPGAGLTPVGRKEQGIEGSLWKTPGLQGAGGREGPPRGARGGGAELSSRRYRPGQEPPQQLSGGGGQAELCNYVGASPARWCTAGERGGHPQPAPTGPGWRGGRRQAPPRRSRAPPAAAAGEGGAGPGAAAPRGHGATWRPPGGAAPAGTAAASERGGRGGGEHRGSRSAAAPGGPAAACPTGVPGHPRPHA